MPSTFYWTGGANDNTWATAGNWNTVRDGSGTGGPPIGGDTIVVDQTNQAINGAATALSYANVTIAFGGSIGSAGTPLTFVCPGTVTVRTQSANIYLGVTAAGTIVTLDVKSTGTGTCYLTGPGACTNVLWSTSANVDISANCAVTTAQGAGGRMTAAANATPFTTLDVGGGTVDTYRPITTANVQGKLTTKGNSCAVATVNVFSGGQHFNWTSSTVTASKVLPGGYASSISSPFQATVSARTNFEGSKNYVDCSNVTIGSTAVIGQTNA